MLDCWTAAAVQLSFERAPLSSVAAGLTLFRLANSYVRCLLIRVEVKIINHCLHIDYTMGLTSSKSARSDQCLLHDETQLIDVLPFVVSYTDRSTVFHLRSTSRMSYIICRHAVLNNSETSRRFIVSALDNHLRRTVTCYELHACLEKLNPMHTYIAKHLFKASEACYTELCWVLRVCGRSVLNEPSFAEDIAAVFHHSIQTARAPLAAAIAAADSVKCFLICGLKIRYKQVLLACTQDSQGFAAWILAHDNHFQPFDFTAAELSAYKLKNKRSSPRFMTIALAAVVHNDVKKLVSLSAARLQTNRLVQVSQP